MMDNEIEDLLHDLGLCKYERKAYLTLLKHGPQNYKSLSDLSDVPYGRIYSTMENLAKKGWTKSLNQRPKIYYATDPEKQMKNRLTEMKEEMVSLEEIVQRVSTQLKALYHHSNHPSEAPHTEEAPPDLLPRG